MKTFGLRFKSGEHYPHDKWMDFDSIIYATTSRIAAQETLNLYFRFTPPEHRPVVEEFAE